MKKIDTIFDRKMKRATPKQKSILLRRRTQLIAELKIALALILPEEKEHLSPSDLLNSGAHQVDPTSYGSKSVMADFLGLQCLPMVAVMGFSEFFADDEQYLKGIEKLDPGFYQISIKTENGGHAIGLIKGEDGNGYVFDPNLGLIKFDSLENAQIWLKKILSAYAPPKGNTPLTKRPHHELQFFKVERKPDPYSTSAAQRKP